MLSSLITLIDRFGQSMIMEWDPELVLPEGEKLDRDIGKNDACLSEKVFCFSHIHDCFVIL